MGKLIDETDLMNLLCTLSDARHDLSYAIKKIPELSPVEAIPKDQYEARLKADMVAMLTEIQLDIEELKSYESADGQDLVMLADIGILFNEKINALRGEIDGKARIYR